MNRVEKMKRVRWLSVLVFMLFASILMAEQGLMVNLTLKDGSVLKGTLLSLDEGIFEVKTTSMGAVKVPESEVVAVRSGDDIKKEVTASPKIAPADLAVLQQKMMNDPVAMEKITALQKNPEFMKMMQKPEVMSAIRSGNLDALSNNKAFIRLMENPNIKALVKDFQ